MEKLNIRNFTLNESQIGLCIDAIESFIDNMVEMLETFNNAPEEGDDEILMIAKMKQLKMSLSGETVETLYLRTDSQDNSNFWIETLEDVKAWFTDYVQMYFDDYSDEELEEIYEEIKVADASNLCEMLSPNEYWIEKIT